jgi:DNA-binding beta-propeller fold protein YncE
MRRLALLAALCAASLGLFAGSAGAHVRGPAGSVWVVNRDRGEVTIFDAASGAPKATVRTGAGAHDVALSRRTHQAYVTNEFDNTVSVLSTRTFAQRAIPLGPGPHHVEPAGDGRTMLVGLVGSNRIGAIDTATDAVREYVSSANPAARAHAAYRARGGETIYVAHETGNEVTGVDAVTGALRFGVGGIVQPSEVLADRGERRLYVSARGEGTIKMIDLATHTVVGEVAVGTQPETMLLTPDGRTLVVTLRGTPAQIALVDTRCLRLIATVPIGEAGTFGDLAAMSRSGRFVFATFDRGAGGTGGVAVVDLQRRAAVSTWDYPGAGRPHGIAYSPKSPR